MGSRRERRSQTLGGRKRSHVGVVIGGADAFKRLPAPLLVPDLFFVECADVLWKNVARSRLTTADALEALADLRSLSIPFWPTKILVEAALLIAGAYGVTVYDACYVALAEAVTWPLVTADLRLVRSLRNTPLTVVSLSEAAT